MQLLRIKGTMYRLHPACPVTGTKDSKHNSELLSIIHIPRSDVASSDVMGGTDPRDGDVRLADVWYEYVKNLIADDLTDEMVVDFLSKPAQRRFFPGVDMEQTVLYSYHYVLASPSGYRIWTLFNLAYQPK